MAKIIAFGEIMLRLNPESYLRFTQSPKFEASYAGGEAKSRLDRRYAAVDGIDNVIAMLEEIEDMIDNGYYDQWYENALVQLIFKHDFQLYYKDICDYEWTEVDCVSDLIKAKSIHMKEA